MSKSSTLLCIRPVKMFLSCRQPGHSNRQQRPNLVLNGSLTSVGVQIVGCAKKFKVRLNSSRNCSVWFVTSLHRINTLLHWITLNCIYLNESELSNFFMCFIKLVKMVKLIKTAQLGKMYKLNLVLLIKTINLAQTVKLKKMYKTRWAGLSV